MVDSIGSSLREARQARSLTLEQVARVTHVRAHYLQALEAGDISAIPSLAQARGFLRIYAGYLGLDAETLLDKLEGGPPSQPAPVASLASEARPAEPPPPAPEAEAAFAEIGLKLRQQREVLGLSLEDIERHTHLRTFYLKALEAGDLDRLPSPVQGRGMLSNYAEFLGMNPEPLLLRFADGLQARLQARMTQRRQMDASRGGIAVDRPQSETRPVKPPSRLRRFFTTELMLGGLLVMALAGFAIWAAARVYALRGEQQPAPTAPPIAAVLLATPSPSPSASPLPVTPTLPLPVQILQSPTPEVTQGVVPPIDTGAMVQVYITIRQRAWVRVLVDGEVEFDGRVIPGSAYQYAGDEKVEILTGNGAAIQVFFNQVDLGPMGLFGEVAHQIYTREGIQTPTPTITLTPTRTERPTRTPRGASQITATP